MQILYLALIRNTAAHKHKGGLGIFFVLVSLSQVVDSNFNLLNFLSFR